MAVTLVRIALMLSCVVLVFSFTLALLAPINNLLDLAAVVWVGFCVSCIAASSMFDG